MRTLFRWLKEPNFDAAYRAAKKNAFGQGIARLHHLTSAAVSTLGKVMLKPLSVSPDRSVIRLLHVAFFAVHKRDGSRFRPGEIKMFRLAYRLPHGFILNVNFARKLGNTSLAVILFRWVRLNGLHGKFPSRGEINSMHGREQMRFGLGDVVTPPIESVPVKRFVLGATAADANKNHDG